MLLFVCVCFVLLCTIYASIWSGGPQIQFRPILERSVLEIMFVYFVGHQCKVEGGLNEELNEKRIGVQQEVWKIEYRNMCCANMYLNRISAAANGSRASSLNQLTAHSPLQLRLLAVGLCLCRYL